MPLLLSIQPLSGTTVSIWKIIEDEAYFIALLQLSDAENQYLKTIRHQSKRLQWLSSRLMIRQHLDTPDFIELQYLEQGQPQLVNFEHHISISHTADVSAVIVSKERKVGIDIEQLFRSVEMVAHKFISEKERSQFNRALKQEDMLFVWSAKEALFKFYSDGQIDFRKHLWVKIPDSITNGITQASINKESASINVAVHYQKINSEYLLCWVAK